MGDVKLDTVEQRVAFIMDNIPEARSNYVFLLLSYWEMFDEINIPEEVVSIISREATQPETINRARRKVLERHRYQQLLQLQRMVKEKD